jgi:PAS domain S-box-containing protein
MPFLRAWPIRSVFLAVALASLAPLLAGELAHTLLLLREDRALAENLSHEAARSVAGNIGRLISDSRGLVAHVAHKPGLTGRGREPANEVLHELLEFQPRFAAAALLDADGRVLAAESRQAVAPTGIVARPEILEGFRRSQTTFVSEPIPGRVSGGRWVCLIGARIPPAPPSHAAYVGASIDLLQVGELLSTFEAAREATITIVSREGRVVARVPESSTAIGRDISQTQLGRLLATRQDGRATAPGFDGEPRLFGFTPIPAAGWIAVVGVPRQAIETGLRNRLLGRLGILVTGLLAGIMFAALAARAIARPIGELEFATEAVARGQAGVAVPIDGPREIRAVGRSFNRMVRTRAATDAALRQSEERFRELAAIVPEVFFLYSVREHRFLYISPAFRAIWGADEEAALADPAAWFDSVAAQDRADFRALFESPEASQETASTIRLERADGSTRTVRVRLFRAPLEGDDCGPLAGLVEDLTPLAQLEDSLKRSERVSALGGVVAGLAHEIRGPLFGLQSLVEAWAARTSDPESARRYLPHLRREIRHMGRLATDLLDYGRDHRLRAEDIPVLALLEAAAQSVRAEAFERGVTVTLGYEGRPGLVRADPARAVDLLANLVDNAVRLSPQGATVELMARAAEAGRWVEIDVLDRGPGIAAEDLPHVFEPFFSRREGGTGVGLALVRRLVEDHGGTIAVVNRGGGGARFTVRLPAGPEAFA